MSEALIGWGFTSANDSARICKLAVMSGTRLVAMEIVQYTKEKPDKSRNGNGDGHCSI